MTQPRTLQEVKDFAIGRWESLSVELRPTEDRAGTGKIEPTRLKRSFHYESADKFTGVITMFADEYGQAPIMEFEFKGDLRWGGAHPIAEGAWEIDYVLCDGFSVTPLHEQTVQLLNYERPEAIAEFELNKKANILKKAFPLFNITEGQIAVDYDLIYFNHGLLFMGAKHVDGTPFDKPERRPHQLQIPLQRLS